MRYFLVLVLPVVLVLSAFGSATAEPRYPYCPPTVGERTLTSTSQRGDEAYPQIVCWYEDKQPVYEFHAGWATESFKGPAGIGCGKQNDDPLKKIISQTHEAYVGTNWNYQNMLGFEAAIDDFLDQLETDFAKPCGAKSFQVNITGNKAPKPGKGAQEYCEVEGKKILCDALEGARLKICNNTDAPRKLLSKSKNNAFGPKKLAPRECLLRKLADPGNGKPLKLSAADRAGVYAIFMVIDMLPDD